MNLPVLAKDVQKQESTIQDPCQVLDRPIYPKTKTEFALDIFEDQWEVRQLRLQLIVAYQNTTKYVIYHKYSHLFCY